MINANYLNTVLFVWITPKPWFVILGLLLYVLARWDCKKEKEEKIIQRLGCQKCRRDLD